MIDVSRRGTWYSGSAPFELIKNPESIIRMDVFRKMANNIDYLMSKRRGPR